jgi:hypothetical protein
MNASIKTICCHGERFTIELALSPARCDHLVRRLVDWGYLAADDCLDMDEEGYATKLGEALGRALPRIVLDDLRRQRRQKSGSAAG